MSLKGLKCQVSNSVNSDACPRQQHTARHRIRVSYIADTQNISSHRCDSWGHTGGWFGVVGKNDVSMGVVMGRDAYCYFNGERNYNWYSVPYCTRNTGSAAPGERAPGRRSIDQR